MTLILTLCIGTSCFDRPIYDPGMTAFGCMMAMLSPVAQHEAATLGATLTRARCERKETRA